MVRWPIHRRRHAWPPNAAAGFTAQDITVAGGVRIRTAVGGQGPPVLLLHGYPQTHATWREIAPVLARSRTVIAPDLRGYGDSAKPPSDPAHAAYAKRTMAADQVAVMRALGHDRFPVVGHDRGGRVAHRMALDHPGAVGRLVVLDIAPTAIMYARTDRDFATRYYHWFFLIQAEPLPEQLIGGAAEAYLRAHLAHQYQTPGVPRGPRHRIPALLRRPRPDPRHLRGLPGRGLDRPRARRGGPVGGPAHHPAAAGPVGVARHRWPALRRAGHLAGGQRRPGRRAGLDCGHVPQEERPAETASPLPPSWTPVADRAVSRPAGRPARRRRPGGRAAGQRADARRPAAGGTARSRPGGRLAG